MRVDESDGDQEKTRDSLPLASRLPVIWDFPGDCARALDDLNVMFREVFGRQK